MRRSLSLLEPPLAFPARTPRSSFQRSCSSARRVTFPTPLPPISAVCVFGTCTTRQTTVPDVCLAGHPPGVSSRSHAHRSSSSCPAPPPACHLCKQRPPLSRGHHRTSGAVFDPALSIPSRKPALTFTPEYLLSLSSSLGPRCCRGPGASRRRCHH